MYEKYCNCNMYVINVHVENLPLILKEDILWSRMYANCAFRSTTRSHRETMQLHFLVSVIKIIWIAVRTGMMKGRAVKEASVSFIHQASLHSEKLGHAFQLLYIIFISYTDEIFISSPLIVALK